MSVEVKIPLEALADQRVAGALAEFLRALGELQSGRRREPRPASPTMEWDSFLETLTPTTQEFLSLIKDNGKLTMTDAVKKLKMSQNKAMGGLTGALSRKAARNGLELPFRQLKTREGERVWVWAAGGERGAEQLALGADPALDLPRTGL